MRRMAPRHVAIGGSCILVAAAGFVVGQTGDLGLRMELACERGIAPACTAAQRWARDYPDYEVFELDAACMLRDDPFACEEAARDLRSEDDEGDGAASEEELLARARSRMARASRLYAERCARGDAESCLGRSRVLDDGFGVAWSPRDARAALERACVLGLARACEQAGDGARGADAVVFYRRACTLPARSPHACMKLARAEEALGAPAAEVDASYRTACDLRVVEACRRLSIDPG